MKKRKLLVTGSTFPRWEGDTEPRFVLDLSEALSEYFDVTVLVPIAIGAKEREVMNGVNVIRYHYFPIHRLETLCYPGAIVPRIKEKKTRIFLVPFLILAQFWNIKKLVSDYDAVHAHWLIPQGIVQSFFNTPYIVTGHGADVTSLNNKFVRKWKRRALTKAGDVTVVSEHLKEKVQEIADVKNIDVISMGCKTSCFGKKHAKDQYFQQGTKKVILFVGRLAEKKGVTYLIEAMKQVDAMLVIVGAGPLEAQLKEQAKEQGDKIIFLGSKTHEELKTIYASADIFAAPSVTAKDGDQEGFGLVILEAMASGMAVVANDSGGIRDLITHGKNGLLAVEKDVDSLAEKLNFFVNNEAERQRCMKEAVMSAKQYDYKKIAERYAEILNKQIKER